MFILSRQLMMHRRTEYLFGQANGHTKFHDISNKIREVYEHEEYAGYQLYVCGHRYVFIQTREHVVIRKDG